MKFMSSKTKTPKEDKHVNIKFSLKEITHKIIRNKTEYKIYNSGFGCKLAITLLPSLN